MRLKEADKLRRTTHRRETSDHSFWLEEKGLVTVYKFICNQCGNREREKTNYCSYCGAKMDEEESHDNNDGITAIDLSDSRNGICD